MNESTARLAFFLRNAMRVDIGMIAEVMRVTETEARQAVDEGAAIAMWEQSAATIKRLCGRKVKWDR